jgi:hypothetical protein
MSCTQCGANNAQGNEYNCPCDDFIHPLPLSIDAGLDKLPRQIATFPEFRRAMLHALRTEQVSILDVNNLPVKIAPLANWRARDKDDLGIMLLEMWAYVCDSLSFYDEVIANECYLRTSYLRPNLRRLVGLLGYQPRPAIASSIEITAIAEGRLQVKLPAGTGFRSIAFNGNPPQVFELDTEQIIHPFTNKFDLKAPTNVKITEDNPGNLLVDLSGQVRVNDLLVILHRTDDSQVSVNRVSGIEREQFSNDEAYSRIHFNSKTNLKRDTLVEDISVMATGLQSALWTTSQLEQSINGNQLALASVNQQISPGDIVVLTYFSEARWFKVMALTTENRQATAESTITINGNDFKMPGLSMPVTVLSLDADINSNSRKANYAANWTPSISANVQVYFGFRPVAVPVAEPRSKLLATDSLDINSIVETPVENFIPTRFFLQDKNTLAADINGNLSFNEKNIDLLSVNDWQYPLTVPVTAFGNILTASRGEKVLNEKLGSGDASIPSQTFKLKKKPLTYLPSPTADNDAGVRSTLTVYVNGVKWKEVPSFFGARENDQVYIIRQNDDGESLVIFGDGIRGQRLPTGIDNVIGNYRFGAEAACPPAGAVSQIATPVKGLQSIKNMLPAYGGADAEDAQSLRTNAPKSALVLGRVVSLKDMEALVAAYRGVRAVQTEWRWDLAKQRASAHIYYIGDPSLSPEISRRLRSYADPSTPISVEPATPKPLFISIDTKIDPRYDEAMIIANLRSALAGKPGGFLLPESIGIGAPLFRSKLFEQVLMVEGTSSVTSILINNVSFSDYATIPGTGNYFDIENGKLIINGREN